MTTDAQLPERLGARLRPTETALLVISLLLVVVCVSVFIPARSVPSTSDVLRVRGIVIEDEQGRARLALGAPITNVAGRTRGEPVTGLLLLGPNGADRVLISCPGLEPQVNGKVEQRSVPVVHPENSI
jgi:hypothetical protein